MHVGVSMAVMTFWHPVRHHDIWISLDAGQNNIELAGVRSVGRSGLKRTKDKDIVGAQGDVFGVGDAEVAVHDQRFGDLDTLVQNHGHACGDHDIPVCIGEAADSIRPEHLFLILAFTRRTARDRARIFGSF